MRPSNISSNLPRYFREVAPDRWLDIRNHISYTSDELKKIYKTVPFSTDMSVFPEWYLKLFHSSRVKLIRTQRLYNFSELNNEGEILTIKSFSRDMANYLANELSLAGNEAAELDRTFPVRLLNYLRGNIKTTASELFGDLQELETKRKKLADIGVLSTEENDLSKLMNLKDDDKDRVLRSVFKLYIKDSQEKLQRYDTVSEKASLFLNIINSRFKNKYLTLDRSKGFVVKPHKDSDNEIDLDKLSLGEQNEIILFYDLIFNTQADSLVMVDEPEISLHLEWLQKMLGDFQNVSELNGFRMLIATHSPDFVGNNYYLVQNLSYE